MIEAFVTAVQNGDIEKVREYIRDGINVDGRTKLQTTAAWAACDSKQPAVIEELIKANADFKILQFQDWLRAYECCELSTIKKLIERVDVNANIGRISPQYLLGIAIEKNDVALFDFLLERGAHFYPNLFLKQAIEKKCSPYWVKKLLDAGANPNFTVRVRDWGMYCDAPLFKQLIDDDRIDILLLILNSDKLAEGVKNEALRYAFKKKKLPVAREILSTGADPIIYLTQSKKLLDEEFRLAQTGQADDFKKTESDIAFSWLLKRTRQEFENQHTFVAACTAGAAAAVKQVLKEGIIDVNQQQNGADAPLLLAVKSGNLETVQLLLAMPEININIKNAKGETALMIACRHADEAVVDALLAKGADVNEKDNRGSTALMTASRAYAKPERLESYERIVAQLLRKGADIAARDAKERNASDWAVTLHKPSIVTILQNHKAEHNNDISVREGKKSIAYGVS